MVCFPPKKTQSSKFQQKVFLRKQSDEKSFEKQTSMASTMNMGIEFVP